uniref:Integrase catalytic domain-containing protein n=1 Tax=Chromera velia CCMP2878 TaxID=1169474 RepID=A0A0G4IFT8_9ALVE|eukprot:Cvel_14093.t1-p1 / transcript=Cvel_14093.t1 / gene=Cvel_14093 / organism=Chromera_velia_CCMP2878 / gene_product=hypothetical protein / transcript_product=hypothetical protein / location=Cvel_scaffold990:38887-40860(+) / protein_length=658 / sequence_SO=supercontig / SO=protein_coding / is_pseudo=false
MKEVGHGGVHIISVLVELLHQWWSLRVLKTKDEADQHLLHLIIAEQIIPKIIRSDNDTVLKLGKTKQLAAEYNIYLEPSPPHCPESHGAVEVANREIRTMLRTALKEIGCDAYVWPVLIPGIEQTHNVTFAPLTGVSPWFGRFQSPPPFVLRFGDPVVFKPPSADKSLSFPSVEGVFIHTVNDTLCEVLYYPPEIERWTVCKLHPIVPKPVRRGVEEAWLGRAARCTGRGNGDGVGGGTEDGEKNKYGCNYYEDMDYKFEEIPEPMVPLVSVEEVSPSRPVRGALAEIDGVLQPVQLIGKMGKKSAEVALMRMNPLGMWRPSEICRVEKAKIVRLFTMMDGEVSKEIMDAVQKSEIDGNGTGAVLIEEVPVPVDVDVIPADFTAFLRMKETALMAMATPMKFSGGTAQRPATRKEINSGIFNGALIKEWAKIFLNSMLGKKVDRDEVVAVLPLSARFIWKENGETGERDTNARVYSQGFKDPREMPTYAGTPSIHSIYIAIIYMLSKDFPMMKADVSGAFLQVEDVCDEKIGIRVPEIRILPDFPDKKPKELSKFTDEQYEIVKKKRKELKEGEIYIADKALYGGPGSARMFLTKAKTELKELGFEEIDESIHVRRETNTNEVNTVIYHHVDDFEGGAIDIEEIFSKYGHRLSLGSLV